LVIAFFTFSFESIFCIIDNINFSLQGELMSNIDATAVAQRIDTVLDILVAGDYHSAIRNLEILKSELLAENGADNAPESTQSKAPWEV